MSQAIQKLLEFKTQQKKITMVTCYDAWSAKLLNQTAVDWLLVGDSVAMVMHGFENTLHANLEMMVFHTKAVDRVRGTKPIVSDLPFLAHRKGRRELMRAADQLMKAGATALKIETQPGQEKAVQYLVESGIPVMGHVGLTPQFYLQLGGFKVQGQDPQSQDKIYNHALTLQDAGVSALILECVPRSLASRITNNLNIPTIGIGAGQAVDGQVLVLHDLLGLNQDFKPRFVRHFDNGAEHFHAAINNYIESVHSFSFPSNKETFL